MMILWRTWILLLCLVAINAQAATLKIAITQENLNGYQKIVGSSSCNDIHDFSIFKENPGIAYPVLVCKFLARHDTAYLTEFVVVPNYRRGLWVAAQGLVDMIAVPFTINEYTQPLITSGAVKVTHPIILKGQQSAGFYALKSNAKVHQVTSVKELKQLIPVIPSSWRYIAKILEDDFDATVQYVNVNRVFEFLKSGRADYTILPLQGDPESGYEVIRKGIKVKPIGRFKVVLNRESYFVFSGDPKSLDDFYIAVQQGIIGMRQNDRLSKILRQANLISSPPKEWQSVYSLPKR